MTRIELQECKHTSREWQTKHEPNMVNSVINVNQGSFGVFSAYTRLDIDIISECTSVRPEPAVIVILTDTLTLINFTVNILPLNSCSMRPAHTRTHQEHQQ